MVKRYSLAFKKRMVEQLTGSDARTQSEVAAKYGVAQYTLSRWLAEARSLPLMPSRPPKPRTWPVDQKIRVLAEASKLTGAELAAYLERERVTLGELEQWRLALEEEGRASKSTTLRIRKLERELARKEKALAEAAALLVLKKKVDQLREDEDDDTDEGTER